MRGKAGVRESSLWLRQDDVNGSEGNRFLVIGCEWCLGGAGFN